MIFNTYQEIAQNALSLNHYNLRCAAADIGMNPKTLHKILTGTEQPTAKTVQKLIIYLAYLTCYKKL